jgi:membrane associated rhomboid family serine protease
VISKRNQRILRAVLPIGIVMMVVWAVWFVVAVGLPPSDVGLGWVSALAGFATSLILIVIGYLSRRDLDRVQKQ